MGGESRGIYLLGFNTSRTSMWMYLGVIIVVLCINCAFGQGGWAVNDFGCRTPDGGVGDCVDIYDCNAILKLQEINLNADKPISFKIDLEKYVCGLTPVTKVCCPREEIANFKSRDSEIDKLIEEKRSLLPEDCGAYETENKVSFGDQAGLLEFPWIVRLGYKSAKGILYRCGGALINNRYVLTAAHCLKKDLAVVQLGEHDTRTNPDCETVRSKTTCTNPTQLIPIEKVHRHPNFSTIKQNNDVALVRLAFSANLSAENVKTICLPLLSTFRKSVPDEVIIAGFGETEKAADVPSNVLLKTTVPIVDNPLCAKAYPSQEISAEHICVKEASGKASCRGDSGGPVQIVDSYNGDVRAIAHGIISLGPSQCGDADLPGLHTSVAYYLPWILKTMVP